VQQPRRRHDASTSPAGSARRAAPTPLQDDRFLLLGPLGQGGMASVFRAFDRVEQRLVALKVGDERCGGWPGHPLVAEFDAWSRLDHPNVVGAFELCRSRSGPFPRDCPYLVLEHVAGGPIHRVLEPGTLDDGELESVAVQALAGLRHVHAAGLVHRDLKPANLLVEAPGSPPRVKLTDFGLAAARGHSERPGTITGSLPYVAPEAVLGRPVDARTDLYGLGIVLFHLATGELPAIGDVDAVLRWHLCGPPADPRRRRASCSARIARFVRRLTARAPQQRPADAGAALDLLGIAAGQRGAAGLATVGRAELAGLRLALDAARLGDRRWLELPDAPAALAAHERTVRVWSQAHGLSYASVAAADDGAASAWAQAALRLLLERGDAAEALVRDFGLGRALPLTLVQGIPVLDHRPARRAASAPAAAATRLVGFLLDHAAQRTLVLRVGGRPPACELSARVVAGLLEACRAPRRLARGRGGLLLLLDRGSVVDG